MNKTAKKELLVHAKIFLDSCDNIEKDESHCTEYELYSDVILDFLKSLGIKKKDMKLLTVEDELSNKCASLSRKLSQAEESNRQLSACISATRYQH